MNENKILYLEALSGISGDMTVAALLDLGANQENLLNALITLGLDGYEIAVTRVKKNGIDACDFNVILAPNSHHHHDSTHEHRNLAAVNLIIDGSGISSNAKKMAKKIFQIVAEAEAEAHGLSLDEVHFHEVGALDSIIDIVAASVCLDDLGLKDVVVSNFCEGRGQVRCQHGLLPVPVPAVVNIFRAHKLKMTITETEGEMITPTGAAIAAAIKTRDELPENFTITKVGLGAGKKEFIGRANFLRAFIIEK